jgi:hypothetical protein
MLLASFAELEPLLEDLVSSSCPKQQLLPFKKSFSDSKLPMMDIDQLQKSVGSAQKRRMSLMTALKFSLENATICDSPTVSTNPVSPAERRFTTYQRLSQAQAL